MTRKHVFAISRGAGVRLDVLLAVVAALGCVGEVNEHQSNTTPPGNPPGNLATDLPCDVEMVMATRCWACHGQTPVVGAPSLTSAASFMAPSRLDPSQSTGTVAVARMQSTTIPMPPAPSTPATPAEIAVLANWISGGYPAGGGCSPICTSGMTWTNGDEGSSEMNPGMACNACHSRGEGPLFSIAGTIYPTVHEPDLCNGAPSSSGAQVVITGADGRVLTLAPNRAGNFYSETAVAGPYQAKIVTAAGERAMTAQQTSGDCNSCHTQAGANGAPGRIMLP
jgi:hypothetical protein